MRCPRCQSALAPSAKFCGQCGAPVQGQPHEAQSVQAYGGMPPGVTPRPGIGLSPGAKWGIAAVVAVAVSAVAFWLGATGILGRQGQLSSPVLMAESPPTGSVLQRPATPSGPTTAIVAPERVQMPADIRAWLEHLERIERERVRIAKEQLGAMLVEMAVARGAGAMEALKALTNPDVDAPEPEAPARRFAGKVETIKRDWNQLVADFNAMPPPRECVPIRNDYDQALRETGAMMFDVVRAIEMADTDPSAAVQKLIGMQGASEDRIDRAAKAADRKIAEICARYETRKWFDVTGDVGGGMLGKIGGL